MGRMRRQRRYKACDPFAKKTKKLNEKPFNMAPKKKNDDHFAETKRFQQVQQGIDRAMAIGKRGGKQQQQQQQQQQQMTHFNMGGEQNKKKKKQKNKKDDAGGGKGLEKQANETKKEYFHRLDKNVNDAINTSMMESRTLRKKRKLHLQARDEKKKKMKKSDTQEEDKGDDDVTDGTPSAPVFGEYCSAPPELTALPRKAAATMGNNKLKGLKLMSILEGNTTTSTTTDNKNNKTANKSSSSSELSKEALEKERQRAIDAYRLLKKQKGSSLGS